MGSIPLVVWLAAGVCFIFSLSGLSKHETSRRGNWLGIAGMLLAIAAAFAYLASGPAELAHATEAAEKALASSAANPVLASVAKLDALENSGSLGPGPGPGAAGLVMVLLALAIGGGIGARLATTVEMTGMPELVAMLHSFVGLAAVLVGWSNWLIGSRVSGHMDAIHLIEIVVGIFIGGYTFTGSILAWGKLNGRFASKPLLLPARHWINLAAALSAVGLVLSSARPVPGGWAGSASFW